MKDIARRAAVGVAPIYRASHRADPIGTAFETKMSAYVEGAPQAGSGTSPGDLFDTVHPRTA